MFRVVAESFGRSWNFLLVSYKVPWKELCTLMLTEEIETTVINQRDINLSFVLSSYGFTRNQTDGQHRLDSIGEAKQSGEHQNKTHTMIRSYGDVVLFTNSVK